MAEHEKYLEKAHESLESAEILFEKEKYNTSISQAYYAMFYASKALLSLKRIYPKTHKGMVSEFGLKFVIEGGWVTVYDRDPEYYYIHYLTDNGELYEHRSKDIFRSELAFAYLLEGRKIRSFRKRSLREIPNDVARVFAKFLEDGGKEDLLVALAV